MATTIRKRGLKYPYLIFSLIALCCFVSVVWYVWKNLEKEFSNRAESMLKDVAISNISIVESEMSHYNESIALIKHQWEVSKNKDILNEEIAYIKAQNNTIKGIFITEKTKNILTFEKDKSKLFRLSSPLNKDHSLIMDVDLFALHHKIAESKKLLHAYITITANEKYIFHPDEKLLGNQIPDTEIQEGEKLIQKHSNFLNLDVYSYSKAFDLQGNSIIITANITNLELQEILQKRGRAFLWILLAALLSFLLIIGVGFLEWRSEFLKRKNAENENLELALKNEQQNQAAISTELEILKSGLNPHFLFNAMSSLKILVSRRPELAKDFAVTLSNVYRYLLRHEKENTVTLEEELKFVEDYVLLQKIRFENKIKLIEEHKTKPQEKRVPPVSIQLLVENAIKHTIISEANPLKIKIYFENDYVVVVNNYQPRLSKIEQTGKGIENLQKRYLLLTDNKCKFYVEEDKFIAKIPLLSTNSFTKKSDSSI